MGNVLTQAAVYLTLLALGYGFKRAGIFRTSDAGFLKSVILYVTMPAVAVNGLKDLVLRPSFAWCFAIGCLTCAALTAAGAALTGKAPLGSRLAYLFSINSFNVGNFAIPFLTGLISTDGFAALCLFDIACTIFLYGVDFGLAEGYKGSGGFSPRLLARKIFTSPITMTYFAMLALAAAGLRLPAPVLKLAEVAGNANGFLAMLSIGILFECRFRREDLAATVKFFLMRYGVTIPLAAAVWLAAPLPGDIRQAVCVLMMAPVASVAPLLTSNAGGDAAKAAQINSVGILLGIVMMVAAYALTGALAGTAA